MRRQPLMFYEPDKGHPLPHDPLKAIVAPRPIGWISTIDLEGRPNLAPYSFFTLVSGKPPMVAFSSEGLKDTPRNAQSTGEFVFNLATALHAEQMNLSSQRLPHGCDEFEYFKISACPSKRVQPPRILGCPAALECKVADIITLRSSSGYELDTYLVIGEVVGVHIEEAFVNDGRFDVTKAQILARCGYRDYTIVQTLFEMQRPPSSPR